MVSLVIDVLRVVYAQPVHQGLFAFQVRQIDKVFRAFNILSSKITTTPETMPTHYLSWLNQKIIEWLYILDHPLPLKKVLKE